jgi:hypothetical protein
MPFFYAAQLLFLQFIYAGWKRRGSIWENQIKQFCFLISIGTGSSKVWFDPLINVRIGSYTPTRKKSMFYIDRQSPFVFIIFYKSATPSLLVVADLTISQYGI